MGLCDGIIPEGLNKSFHIRERYALYCAAATGFSASRAFDFHDLRGDPYIAFHSRCTRRSAHEFRDRSPRRWLLRPAGSGSPAMSRRSCADRRPMSASAAARSYRPRGRRGGRFVAVAPLSRPADDRTCSAFPIRTPSSIRPKPPSSPRRRHEALDHCDHSRIDSDIYHYKFERHPHRPYSPPSSCGSGIWQTTKS